MTLGTIVDSRKGTQLPPEPVQTDIRELINHGPMSRYQIIAVGICVALNMLDGFDVLVVAFTAAPVTAEWNLSGTEMGVLLSAGLIGMGAGSLLFSPWADKFGRRPIIVLSLLLITIGMLASALVRSFTELALLRALTGMGIGGVLPSISVITSEYSSDRWRSTAMGLMSTGYTVGATLGGVIAAALLALYGWRSVFFFGGMLSVVFLPIVLWCLPESMDFLVASRPPSALRKLNRLMGLMGRDALRALPAVTASAEKSRSSVRQIVSGEMLRSTVLIWSAFFLVMAGFYFVMSWTPKLLLDSGVSMTQGVTGGVLLNLGGIAGGMLFSMIAYRFQLRRVTALYLILSTIMLILFGLSIAHLAIALTIAVLIGAFVTGAIAGLYALTPLLYPPVVRVTGMGWAIGVGRIGAISAPLLAGALIDLAWHATELFCLFSVPFLLTVAAIRAIKQPQTI